MNIALLLSGGTGTRLMSDIPKQYIEVCGKPVILYGIESLSAHKRIDVLHIVADPVWQRQIKSWLQSFGCGEKIRGFSHPGENRQLSIFNGLKDIRKYAADSDWILIHDAARPLLSSGQITDCLDGAQGHDGVLPVLPMKDTVYRSKTGKSVDALLNRSEIYAGQAPEIFHLGKYYKANQELLPEKILRINGSTEPAILAEMDIAMIPGDEKNFKITTAEDLERFIRIIKEKREGKHT